MNKTLLNILLFVIGFSILWFFTYPLYSGGGMELLGRKSALYYYSRYKELRAARTTAADLVNNGNRQVESFNVLESEAKKRIDSAIAYPFDIARTVNDINDLASKRGLQMRDIRFSTPNPNQAGSIAGVSTYAINFSVEGQYSSFKEFIGSLEYSLQLYTVKSISFTSANDPVGRMRFSVSLDTYELRQ